MKTLKEFISEFYIEVHGLYFSRYDTTTSYSKKELKDEYERYGRRPDYWLEEYQSKKKNYERKMDLP